MPFDMNARIDEWMKSLLDTTKRNRLINFTAGRGGGVAIVSPSTAALWQRLVLDGEACTFPWKRDILGLPPEAIDGDASGAEFAGDVESATVARPRPTAAMAFPFLAPSATRQDAPAPGKTPPAARPKTLPELTAECLASGRLDATDLLTPLSDKKLAADLLRLARGASEAETDHGVTTLYAAFGFLRWYESVESDEPILAPLVLVPVRLARASVQAPWTLRADDDDPTTNHCLAELLANDFKLPLPAGSNSEIGTDDGVTAKRPVNLHFCEHILGSTRVTLEVPSRGRCMHGSRIRQSARIELVESQITVTRSK